MRPLVTQVGVFLLVFKLVFLGPIRRARVADRNSPVNADFGNRAWAEGNTMGGATVFFSRAAGTTDASDWAAGCWA